MARYKRKERINAWQFIGAAGISGTKQNSEQDFFGYNGVLIPVDSYYLKTKNGPILLNVTDWVVKYDNNEKYVLSDTSFNDVYENE